MCVTLWALALAPAAGPVVVDLWPGEVPGPPALASGPERDLTKPGDKRVAGRRVARLGHVREPQAHVYLPPAGRANGGAAVVCPGGGFSVLAWDLEGTEVAAWLNGLGYAAVVLKYRVPTRGHGAPDKWRGPVMDVQRALSLARANAAAWRIDPRRVGVVGFSAGGEAAAVAAVKGGARLYEPADRIDESACAADFALLVYPGGLAERDGALKPHLAVVKGAAPPTFFAHAADDRVSCLNSVALFTGLKRAGVPAELHVYPSGGHGYGLRPTGDAVTLWPRRAAAWLRGVAGPRGAYGEKLADPADRLPPHARRLTWLGERPDWRADSRRFVFVSRTFGEVYEYDLASGRVRSLSDHFAHHGFTRAQYLQNGDLLLVGPGETFDRTDRADRRRARKELGRMSVLRRPFGRPPVPLGVAADEGPAVARNSLRVAWTHGDQDEISVGRISYEGGVPKLVDRRRVLTAADFDPKPAIIETQNFVPPAERLLTVSGYTLGGGNNTDTFVLDTETGRLRNVTASPGFYDEPEGVFPDGKATLTERGPSADRAWPLIDLYKQPLAGGRPDRLTFFTDAPGWKASQGVVSGDGRLMLFQVGKDGDEAGRGYGIFLYDFDKAARK